MTNRQLNEDAMTINNSSLDSLLNDIDELVYTLDEMPMGMYGDAMNNVYQSLMAIVENSSGIDEDRMEEIKKQFKKYKE